MTVNKTIDPPKIAGYLAWSARRSCHPNSFNDAGGHGLVPNPATGGSVAWKLTLRVFRAEAGKRQTGRRRRFAPAVPNNRGPVCTVLQSWIRWYLV